jgi:hypothetical protein
VEASEVLNLLLILMGALAVAGMGVASVLYRHVQKIEDRLRKVEVESKQLEGLRESLEQAGLEAAKAFVKRGAGGRK